MRINLKIHNFYPETILLRKINLNQNSYSTVAKLGTYVYCKKIYIYYMHYNTHYLFIIINRFCHNKAKSTGCSLNIVFFRKFLKYILDSGLSRFFLGVYTGLKAWTTRWQVKDQRCSRTGTVKKNYNI